MKSLYQRFKNQAIFNIGTKKNGCYEFDRYVCVCVSVAFEINESILIFFVSFE